MKITHISALAALVVMSQVAFAQPPAATTTTTTTSAGDPGNVSNVGSITSSTSPSTDVLPSDTTADPALDAPKGEMANTGGEPQILLMAGLVLAACGLLLRRKTAGQAV